MLKVVGTRVKGEEVAMLVSWHGRKLGRLKQSGHRTGSCWDRHRHLELIQKLMTWKKILR